MRSHNEIMLHLLNKRRAVERSIAEYGDSMPSEHVEYKVRLLLPAIDAAIARIESGAYGYCTSCEELINDERLLRLPEAAHCVACQSKEEKHGKS